MRQGTFLACVMLSASVASAQPVVRARVSAGGNMGAVPHAAAAPGASLVPALSLGAGLQPSLAPSASRLDAPQLAPSLSALPAAAPASAALSAGRAAAPSAGLAAAPAAANDAPESGRLPVPAATPGSLVPVSREGEAAPETRELSVVGSLGALVPASGISEAEAARSERRLALTYDGGRERPDEAEEAVAGRGSAPLLLTARDDSDAAAEPAAPVPPAPPAARGPSPLERVWDALPKATALLIAANVLVYAVVGAAQPEWIFTSAFDVDLARGAFLSLDPGGMLAALGRGVSSAFLHSSPAALLGNMAALAAFGALVERGRGPKAVAGLYAAGLAASQLLTALLAPHVLAFGSAGAIFGLVTAFLLGGELRAALAALREPRRLLSGADGRLKTLATLGVLALAGLAAAVIGYNAQLLLALGTAAHGGAAAGALGGLLGGALVLAAARLPALRLPALRRRP